MLGSSLVEVVVGPSLKRAPAQWIPELDLATQLLLLAMLRLFHERQERIPAAPTAPPWIRNDAPASRELLAACVETLLHHAEDPIGELRTGLASATRALKLVTLLAESPESIDRAILFLARPRGLEAIAGFGAGLDGRLLADSTRDLVVPHRESGLLAACVSAKQPRSQRFEEAGLPIDLVALLGRPRSHQALAFPVLVGERVIAAIYADNGRHLRIVDAVDLVERAAACAAG